MAFIDIIRQVIVIQPLGNMSGFSFDLLATSQSVKKATRKARFHQRDSLYEFQHQIRFDCQRRGRLSSWVLRKKIDLFVVERCWVVSRSVIVVFSGILVTFEA